MEILIFIIPFYLSVNTESNLYKNIFLSIKHFLAKYSQFSLKKKIYYFFPLVNLRKMLRIEETKLFSFYSECE